MKLDQQCGMCRSYIWCGRMCRHAPTIYEAPGLPEEPRASRAQEVSNAVNAAIIAREKPVQAVSKRKAPKVAKPKKSPTVAVSESAKGFDRKAYQREYMKRRRAEAKAKSQ